MNIEYIIWQNIVLSIVLNSASKIFTNASRSSFSFILDKSNDYVSNNGVGAMWFSCKALINLSSRAHSASSLAFLFSSLRLSARSFFLLVSSIKSYGFYRPLFWNGGLSRTTTTIAVTILSRFPRQFTCPCRSIPNTPPQSCLIVWLVEVVSLTHSICLFFNPMTSIFFVCLVWLRLRLSSPGVFSKKALGLHKRSKTIRWLNCTKKWK